MKGHMSPQLCSICRVVGVCGGCYGRHSLEETGSWYGRPRSLPHRTFHLETFRRAKMKARMKEVMIFELILQRSIRNFPPANTENPQLP